MMDSSSIKRFSGPYHFLSNFVGKITTADNREWPTVEHAYQAAKTTNVDERNRIHESPSPADAKRIGRAVHLRRDWDSIKLSLMEDLVRRKFRQNSDLRQSLIGTGEAILVEGNTWGDIYWGVCRGIGENHLGRILMKIRGELSP